MSVARERDPDESVAADYHGLPARRLQNDHLWVDMLESAGPRVVRMGLAGSSENLLAETPDAGWETPHGRYDLFGGHRLWFAPEDPDLVAIPDATGLVIAAEPGGLRLTGRPEPETGLVRSIVVHLDHTQAALEFCHEIRNVGDRPIELSPWSITQLPLGGSVILPQAPAISGHAVKPNRTLVLWPYTSWEDPRLELSDGLMVVQAEAGASLKIGYFNAAGWVAYRRAGTVLVCRFEPGTGRPHPDLGCNVETYCGPRFLELEVLGPLGLLQPGEIAIMTERWELRCFDRLVDPAAIASAITAE